MDLTPKRLVASVLFAMAEQRYGERYRNRMWFRTGRAGELFVAVE